MFSMCSISCVHVDGGVTANVGSAAAVGGVGVLVVVEVEVMYLMARTERFFVWFFLSGQFACLLYWAQEKVR